MANPWAGASVKVMVIPLVVLTLVRAASAKEAEHQDPLGLRLLALRSRNMVARSLIDRASLQVKSRRRQRLVRWTYWWLRDARLSGKGLPAERDGMNALAQTEDAAGDASCRVPNQLEEASRASSAMRTALTSLESSEHMMRLMRMRMAHLHPDGHHVAYEPREIGIDLLIGLFAQTVQLTAGEAKGARLAEPITRLLTASFTSSELDPILTGHLERRIQEDRSTLEQLGGLVGSSPPPLGLDEQFAAFQAKYHVPIGAVVDARYLPRICHQYHDAVDGLLFADDVVRAISSAGIRSNGVDRLCEAINPLPDLLIAVTVPLAQTFRVHGYRAIPNPADLPVD